MKTIEQIKVRIEELEKENQFLDFRPGTLEECVGQSEAEVRATVIDYLDFAFDKAICHRGLSAERSISRFSAWCWVLDRPDLVEICESDTLYSKYGVPILKRVAAAFDVPLPEDIAQWVDGQPCKPGCDNGC